MVLPTETVPYTTEQSPPSKTGGETVFEQGYGNGCFYVPRVGGSRRPVEVGAATRIAKKRWRPVGALSRGVKR